MKKIVSWILAALLALCLLPALAEGLEIEEEPVVIEDEEIVFSEDVDNAVAEEDFMLFSDEPVEKGYADFLTEGEEAVPAEAGDVPIDAAHFPDAAFREYVSSEFDDDHDGVLTQEEAGLSRWGYTYSVSVSEKSISSLKGIEYLTGLGYLYCSDNLLTSLDLSKNTALTYLSCNGNKLTSLDLSKNTALTKLWCNDNKLTSLDLSKNTVLTRLDCYDNKLTSLNVSGLTALTRLSCYKNELTTLDVSGNTALQYLSCDDNKLTALSTGRVETLQTLYCNKNQLAALDLSGNTGITEVNCGANQLTSLKLGNCVWLEKMDCYNNQLSSLDLSGAESLDKLDCKHNDMAVLDLSVCGEELEGALLNNPDFKVYSDTVRLQGNKYNLEYDRTTKLVADGNTIRAASPKSISLPEESVTLIEGETYQLQPILDPTDSEAVITYHSYSDWCVTVSETGLITAIGDGETTVRVRTDNSLEAELNVKVIGRKIENCEVSVKNATYTGKALKPAVTVTFNGTKLKKGTDYTLKYWENKYVGTGYVTVKGKGKFSGERDFTFKIKPKGTTLSKVTPGKKKLTVTWKKQSKQVSGYQIQYGTKKDFSNAKKLTVKGAKTVKATIKSLKAKKTYYVRIRTYKTVSGKKYYSSWSKYKKVKTK